ncbi:hypothetical protein [Breznakia pachnodae]|uniref:DUF4178 domain-containing protein n=1 Tax=Breznakia pachnodae TaxID=265178 RepID=A0ABU0E6K8_9FIRM|nr:hypothetical protein [Breznakia pachnodae]MDQ0362500.1 hypothetical protein [Breznakia pachnodae]
MNNMKRKCKRNLLKLILFAGCIAIGILFYNLVKPVPLTYDAFYKDVEVYEFASDKQQFKIDYVGRIYENDSFIYNYEITNNRLPSELIYSSDEPLDWVDDNTYLKGEIVEYYIQDKYDSSMFATKDTYAQYQYYNIWQLVIKSDEKDMPFQEWKDENLEKVYEKYVEDWSDSFMEFYAVIAAAIVTAFCFVLTISSKGIVATITKISKESKDEKENKTEHIKAIK